MAEANEDVPPLVDDAKSTQTKATSKNLDESEVAETLPEGAPEIRPDCLPDADIDKMFGMMGVKGDPLGEVNRRRSDIEKDHLRTQMTSATSAGAAFNQGEEDLSDSDDEDDDDEEFQSDGSDYSWIQWFCSLKGNDFMAEVDQEWIDDDFNLTGLSSLVAQLFGHRLPSLMNAGRGSVYDFALDIILDIDSDFPTETDEEYEPLNEAAEFLYGMIHARWIITSRGLHAMYGKYVNGDFGRCPRVMCEDQHLLPVGLSDVPQYPRSKGFVGVKTYCPCCKDVYQPKFSRHHHIDGAFVGTTFPHLFLMQFPELVRENTKSYVPRIFGFKIHVPPSEEKPKAKEKSKKGTTGDAGMNTKALPASEATPDAQNVK